MNLRAHPMLVGCLVAVAALVVLAALIALPFLYVPCSCEVCGG